jgi:hypothetical protein
LQSLRAIIQMPLVRSVTQAMEADDNHAQTQTAMCQDLMPTALLAGRRWNLRQAGFDEFLLSVYTLGDGAESCLAFMRRLGRPCFTARERLLVHGVSQGIGWMHRDSVSALIDQATIRLPPRQRQGAPRG